MNKRSALARRIVEEINEIARAIGREVRIMDICGTHEDTINRGGIREILPRNIHLFAGPGCPVCITPVEDIAAMMKIAEQKDMIVTTFGDMYRIPTPRGSFSDFRARGYDVRVVYSIYDAYRLALKNDRLVVHFSPGFETTTAPTAGILSEVVERKIENFRIYSVHRLTPPAVEYLLKEGTRIDALITPGHVSAIIGVRGWRYLTENYGIPQVISGFDPLDVLLSILMLLKMIQEGRKDIENEYSRVVEEDGNIEAQEKIERFFTVRDAKWRALGIIPKSGLYLRDEYQWLDIRSEIDAPAMELPDLEAGCRCGEILRGLALPDECPLFGRVCTPSTPVGPCMVSSEGTCSVFYKYRKRGMGAMENGG